MDIANIKPTERTIEIEHPYTGQPLGIRVTLVSLDDDRLKRIKRNITDESLKLQAKNKSFKADDLDRNAKALLWAATTSWQWYNPTGNEGDAGYDPEAHAKWDGEVPEFNQRNFYDVVEKQTFIADQIREALEDARGFFGNSKAS